MNSRQTTTPNTYSGEIMTHVIKTYTIPHLCNTKRYPYRTNDVQLILLILY